MIQNPLLRTLTRATLVVLFPYSAADKILHWCPLSGFLGQLAA